MIMRRSSGEEKSDDYYFSDLEWLRDRLRNTESEISNIRAELAFNQSERDQINQSFNFLAQRRDRLLIRRDRLLNDRLRLEHMNGILVNEADDLSQRILAIEGPRNSGGYKKMYSRKNRKSNIKHKKKGGTSGEEKSDEYSNNHRTKDNLEELLSSINSELEIVTLEIRNKQHEIFERENRGSAEEKDDSNLLNDIELLFDKESVLLTRRDEILERLNRLYL